MVKVIQPTHFIPESLNGISPIIILKKKDLKNNVKLKILPQKSIPKPEFTSIDILRGMYTPDEN